MHIIPARWLKYGAALAFTILCGCASSGAVFQLALARRRSKCKLCQRSEISGAFRRIDDCADAHRGHWRYVAGWAAEAHGQSRTGAELYRLGWPRHARASEHAGEFAPICNPRADRASNVRAYKGYGWHRCPWERRSSSMRVLAYAVIYIAGIPVLRTLLGGKLGWHNPALRPSASDRKLSAHRLPYSVIVSFEPVSSKPDSLPIKLMPSRFWLIRPGSATTA